MYIGQLPSNGFLPIVSSDAGPQTDTYLEITPFGKDASLKKNRASGQKVGKKRIDRFPNVDEILERLSDRTELTKAVTKD